MIDSSKGWVSEEVGNGTAHGPSDNGWVRDLGIGSLRLTCGTWQSAVVTDKYLNAEVAAPLLREIIE